MRFGSFTTGSPSGEVRATLNLGSGRDAPGSRTWLVTYAAIPAPDVAAVVPELGQAEEELTGALADAHDLAVEQELDSWAQWFEKALASDPEMPFHPDMMPSGWPRLAQNALRERRKHGCWEGWGPGTTSVWPVQRCRSATGMSQRGCTAPFSVPCSRRPTARCEALIAAAHNRGPSGRARR
jgi:hypothetical protein